MMTSATKISLSLHEVVTTRKAKMPWDVFLNEDDNDAAAKKISVLDKPPEFESNDIYGIINGTVVHQEGEWKTTIKLKGDLRIYEASHPSGHFKKMVWKKGIGLVEYASGYGTHADGYRLKRITRPRAL